MKVLIIGYGSIGKRHYEVLSSISVIDSIDLVTRQNIENIKCYCSLEKVNNIDKYDYFVIASETNKHYKQLKYLDENVTDKTIFCEKPLFENKKNISIKNNLVYVGYVLRFHPLLTKLKDFIKNEKVLSINAKCGQYLPSWRPDSDYTKSYSAKKQEGGGVLLDLSHEIDYVKWLAGEFIDIKSYQVKISDLKIDSDDFTTIIGKTQDDIFINISIDYISKITHRKMIVDTVENSYELDFISNKLLKIDKDGLEENYSFANLKRNYMFLKMHLDILNNKINACTFKEGLEVMNTISMIQEQNR